MVSINKGSGLVCDFCRSSIDIFEIIDSDVFPNGGVAFARHVCSVCKNCMDAITIEISKVLE